MSAQTEAMRSSKTSSRKPVYASVAVTGSGTLTAGLAFALLSAYTPAVQAWLWAVTSALALGLVAGFVARLSLPQRGSALRWLVALFGLSCGLLFLGWLSQGTLGLDLFHPALSGPDWGGLLRLALGGGAAWLAVRAWKAAGGLKPAPAARPETPARTPRLRPSRSEQPRRRRLQVGKSPASRVRRIPRPKAPKTRQPIRLSTEVEHRCPYCLELVHPGDPRGVKECPICHTLHHADCWAVTGTCQVPHHQT